MGPEARALGLSKLRASILPATTPFVGGGRISTVRARPLAPKLRCQEQLGKTIATIANILAVLGVELPRFRGHLSSWEEEVSAMPKTRPPYPAVFRQQMVELVRSGRTPGELAREFEPSAQAIRNWVAQARRHRPKPLTTTYV